MGYAGDGCVAMRREAHVDMGGPSGGSGGAGGSIYLRCNEGMNTLSGLRQKVRTQIQRKQ
jgi:GTP-binding protein